MSSEEEDTCMSSEEEDTYIPAMPVRSMDVRSSHDRAIWIMDMVVAPPVHP
jgi:hypothetical protein